jgi:hypothetical protein
MEGVLVSKKRSQRKPNACAGVEESQISSFELRPRYQDYAQANPPKESVGALPSTFLERCHKICSKFDANEGPCRWYDVKNTTKNVVQ